MTGFVHRRRYKTLVYPTSIEAYLESGEYLQAGYREDYGGFTARVLASPNGQEERALTHARIAYVLASNPRIDDDGTVIEKINAERLEATRSDYLREIAWRIPEWDLTEENRDGEHVKVPAPGESEDNWQALELLPNTVMWWLIEEVRTAHQPDPPLPGPAGTTETPTPTSTGQVTTPQSPSESLPATA